MPKTQKELTESRGYRNKNPGNIDYSPNNRWQGLAEPPIETTVPGVRPRFCRFTSHEFGIRAIAVLLTGYQDRHGLRTIRDIINRWAPPKENHTNSYVDFVDRLMPNHTADDELDLHTYRDMRPLVEAIIRQELGGNPYPASTIDEGLRLAGLPKPVNTNSEAIRTQAGTGATIGAAATATAGVIVQALPALRGVAELPLWLGITIVVFVAAAAVAFVLGRRKKMYGGAAQ